MRKIISLGLLALMFSLVSGQALAGNVPYCEENKQPMIEYGLYGLCNAYHNADNETARAQIEFNYDQKAFGTDAPPIRPPIANETECPCWTIASGRLDDAVNPYRCETLAGSVSALYDSPDVAYTVSIWGPTYGFCSFEENIRSGAYSLDAKYVEGPVYDACLNKVIDLIAAQFAGITCVNE